MRSVSIFHFVVALSHIAACCPVVPQQDPTGDLCTLLSTCNFKMESENVGYFSEHDLQVTYFWDFFNGFNGFLYTCAALKILLFFLIAQKNKHSQKSHELITLQDGQQLLPCQAVSKSYQRTDGWKDDHHGPQRPTWLHADSPQPPPVWGRKQLGGVWSLRVGCIRDHWWYDTRQLLEKSALKSGYIVLLRTTVSNDLSFGGTYSGTEPMGLLWSLRPVQGSKPGLR